MKKNAWTPEKMKAVLDEMPSRYIAELSEQQIDISDLEAEPSASKEHMSGISRTVVTVGGIAAGLILVCGIGALLNASNPETIIPSADGTAENDTTDTAAESLVTDAGIVTTAPRQSVAASSDTTNTATTTPLIGEISLNASASADEKNAQTKTTVVTTPAAEHKQQTTNNNVTTKKTAVTTAPPQTTTEKYSNTLDTGDTQSSQKLTLEIMKQIIAESSSFQEMLEKAYAIEPNPIHYGSGVDYTRFDMDSSKSEYILFKSDTKEIFYFIEKEFRILYAPPVPEEKEKEMDDQLEEYLLGLGYSAKEIAIMQSADIDISSRGTQIAIGYCTYDFEHSPILHEEIPYSYNADTTELLGWERGLGRFSYLNCNDPFCLEIEQKTYEPSDNIYSGRMFLEFQDGVGYHGTFSLCNLVFKTSNIQDIQLESDRGDTHLQYLGDLNYDNHWTYEDLQLYFNCWIVSDCIWYTPTQCEAVYAEESLVGSALSNPYQAMERLCAVLKGKVNGFCE